VRGRHCEFPLIDYIASIISILHAALSFQNSLFDTRKKRHRGTHLANAEPRLIGLALAAFYFLSFLRMWDTLGLPLFFVQANSNLQCFGCFEFLFCPAEIIYSK